MERASETELGMEKGKKKKTVFRRESTDLNSAGHYLFLKENVQTASKNKKKKDHMTSPSGHDLVESHMVWHH